MNPTLENPVIALSGVVGYQEDFSSPGIKGSNPTADKALRPQVSVFCVHSGLEMGFVRMEESYYVRTKRLQFQNLFRTGTQHRSNL